MQSTAKRFGSQWLGELPNEWKQSRAKLIFTERKEKSLPADIHLTPSQKHGVLPQSEYMKITGGRVVLNLTGANNMKHVTSGDFVIHLRSFQGGIEYSKYNGKVSNAYTVLEPSSKINHNFYRHVLKSHGFISELSRTTDQLRDGQSIKFSQLDLLKFPVPDLDKQQKIADFLDTETAKIDNLITKQERLLQLLEEKRRATITHVVTRGLDPHVELKETNIPWLGKIPKQWDITSIKRIAKLKSGGNINSEEINSEGRYPVYGGNGLRGYTHSYTHSGDYVLIGRQGALCGNINYANGEFWASEHALVANPIQSYDVGWFGELLHAMNLGQYSVSAAQPGLSVDNISKLRIPVPSIEEQEIIARYLTHQNNKKEELDQKIQTQIALLRERRTSLISHAVTGKVKIT